MFFVLAAVSLGLPRRKTYPDLIEKRKTRSDPIAPLHAEARSILKPLPVSRQKPASRSVVTVSERRVGRGG